MLSSMKERTSPRRHALDRSAVLVSLALLLAALGCGRGRVEPRAPSASATPTQSGGAGALLHDGLERSYRLRLPDDYQSQSPTPLVLALHGGGGDKDQMCDLTGSLADLVDQEGFLLLCPQGIEGHWNDGRAGGRYRAHRENTDDVGFLLALLEQVSQEHSVDPARVYVTGASNGGMMTYRLACQAPDEFAAAAAVIANLPVELDCRPERPVPIMIMNGTEDPLMPYQGGQVRFLGQELGAVRSAEATAHFWAEANGCRPEVEREELEEVDPEDGTSIRLERYGDCDGGSEVLFYTVVGGGHTWPGGRQYAGERLIGPISREGHMGSMVWAFFERH